MAGKIMMCVFPMRAFLHSVYLHRIASVWSTLLKKSFLTTPNVVNKFWSSYETLENTGEMKLVIKFCLCLFNFSLDFEIHFLEFPQKKKCFWCYFKHYLYLWLPENVKRTVKYLKVFWYKVFVHRKLKLPDFLANLVLIWH